MHIKKLNLSKFKIRNEKIHTEFEAKPDNLDTTNKMHNNVSSNTVDCVSD